MKKYFLLLSVVIIGLSSCKKSSPSFDAAAQAATDDAAIKAYIANSNIVATKDPSGLYYQVLTPGTGPYPTAKSNVTVGYTGSLLDGTSFDTQSSTYFNLAGLVQGWQIGVPHINAGGTILLIVPSGLGYGNAVHGSIPANSVLLFKITLQGFNNSSNN
jgi:FKBP-type peptidyl-prolyl cis-trans isomerase FkpA